MCDIAIWSTLLAASAPDEKFSKDMAKLHAPSEAKAQRQTRNLQKTLQNFITLLKIWLLLLGRVWGVGFRYSQFCSELTLVNMHTALLHTATH